jgi:hypothetical protein
VANDALILGLAGIATSGVLGPWAASRFAKRRQEQEFKHGLIAGDRGELRELVDAAAVALLDASYARGTAYASLITNGPSIGERDAETVKKMTEAGRQLDTLKERLAVRLTRTHPVAQTFFDANGAYFEAFKPVQRVANIGHDQTFPEEWKAFEAAGQVFEERREAFMDAAAEHIGSRLPQ